MKTVSPSRQFAVPLVPQYLSPSTSGPKLTPKSDVASIHEIRRRANRRMALGFATMLLISGFCWLGFMRILSHWLR